MEEITMTSSSKSRQSELISMCPIGNWSGREVRDILTNDKNIPIEISERLILRIKGYTSFAVFKNAVDQGCITYQGVKYKLCYGTTPWAMKNNFTHVLIDLRYWGVLSFGYAYVTGLHEQWISLYPNGMMNLYKARKN